MRLLAFAALGAALIASAPVCAESAWTIEPLDAPPAFAPAGPPATERVDDALPDGRVALYGDRGDVVAAWYAEPTRRYGHAVLGDAIEAGALDVETAGGARRRLRLPQTFVFEDRYPRLADLDRDGRVEIVAIRASLTLGAAVVIYGLDGESVVERAASAPIGRANRWLNIAGVGRFRGGDSQEIAFVRTPHIGGALVIAAYETGALVEIAERSGFSNHEIGAPELRLSAVIDVDADGRDELALPSADRRRLLVVGLRGGALEILADVAAPARIDKAIRARGEGAALRLVIGVESGDYYEIGAPREP